MLTPLIYAQLSAYTYANVRGSKNQPALPTNWTDLSSQFTTTGFFGFSGGVYRNGNNIVIAYEGTNSNFLTQDGIDDGLTDIATFIGQGVGQVESAALLYEQVKQQYGSSCTITFTGHSLGGGLASLMSVFFNRPSVTFDPAPFGLTAWNPFAVGILKTYLASLGYNDADLNSLAPATSGPLALLNPFLLHSRQSNITNYALNGEFLWAARNPITNLGPSPTVVDVGANSLSGLQRHSISLLLAAQNSAPFDNAAKAMPALLPLMFDQTLYGVDLGSNTRTDFLGRLVNYQFGGIPAGETQVIQPDNMLNAFGLDILRISHGGLASDANLQAGLIVAGIEYYNFADPTKLADFFHAVGNGVSFDLNAINLALSLQQGYGKLASFVQQHYGALVGDSSLLALDTRPMWFVQTGTSGMHAANTSGESSLMLGGATGNLLEGGSASDLIFGGAGNDTLIGGSGTEILVGGAGNDTLIGGSGADRFVYALPTSGTAADTITDSYDNGTVWVGGTELTGTTNSGSNFTWTDGNGDQYQFAPSTTEGVGTLTISGGLLGGAGDQIVIDNFDLNQAETGANGYLGIKLGQSLALVQGTNLSSNPFLTGGAIPSGQSSSLSGSSSQTYTVYLAAASDVAQTLTLGLTGADPGAFAADEGSSVVSFASGTVTLTVAPGQDSVTFGLVNTDTTAAAGTLQLTATLGTPGSANALSGSIGVDFLGNAAASAVTPDYTIYGDLTPVNSGTASNPVYQYDSLGNVITDGTPDPNFNDTLYGSTGNDLIETGGGNNSVDGKGGNDTIYGGSGNDTIQDGSGNNLVVGNGGQDIIQLGNGANQVYVNTQTDVASAIAAANAGGASGVGGSFVAVGSGDNTLVGGTGNDAFILGGGNDLVVLGPGNDTVEGGEDVTAVQAGWTTQNTIQTSSTTTTYSVTFQGATMVSSGGFSSPYTSSAEVNVDSNGVAVGGGSETIFGGSGNDFILGSNGGNYIDVGSGNSTVFSGAGNDTIFAGTGNSDINGQAGNDFIEGESGTDRLSGGAGNNTIFGGSGNDTILAGEGWINGVDPANGDNYVYGGTGNCDIAGAAGNDTLIGGSGKDTIYAGTGNEYLYGGSGNDLIIGSEFNGSVGTDTLIAGGGGADTLVAGTGATYIYGGDGTDSIWGGNGNDTIYAGDGGTVTAATKITAGTGNTTIYGGLGVDQIYGGSGNTEIHAGDGGTDAASTIVEAGSGNSAIYAGAGVDQITGGSGSDTLYGGSGADTLTAGSGATSLYGGSGTDVMYGGSGSDTFIAGTGEGTLVGGSGTNTYQLNAGFGNVEIDPAASTDTVEFGAGINLADLTVSADLTAGGSAALAIDDGQGDHLLIKGGLDGAINSFTFDSTATTLTLAQLITQASTSSADLTGANGNLIVGTGDGNSLTGGSGADSVYGWGNSDTLTASTGNTLLTATGDLALVQGGTGNDSLNGWGTSDTLVAGSGNDQLTATGNDALLVGGAGTDTLNAAGLAATLQGGSGNDTFIVNDPNDVVTKAANQGTNTILASVSYVLPSNVQNLTLTGSADLTGTGNDLANVITANSGNDTLVAGTGLATLVGGAGNDTFVINNVGDVIQAQSTGSNVNTVESSVSVFAPTNVQDVTLTGTASLAAFGNGLANVLTANSGNDSLVAGTGVATLVGGSGNDLFLVNNASDVVNVQAGSGNDTVDATVSYTLPDNVQTLNLMGSGPMAGTGNGMQNTTIVAGSGNDTLTGGSGSGTLVGGQGVDTFVLGGTGSGTYTAIAQSGTSAVMQLSQGLSFSDVMANQSGNDLVLTVGSSSLRLQNYFVDPQEWTLEDSLGNTTTAQTLLNATAQAQSNLLSYLESQFFTQVKENYIQQLVAQGYVQQSDGSWYIAPYLNGAISANYTFQNSDETDLWMNASTGVITVTTTNNQYKNWSTNAPYVDDFTANISPVTTDASASVINVQGASNNVSSSNIWLNVTWAPLGKPTVTYGFNWINTANFGNPQNLLIGASESDTISNYLDYGSVNGDLLSAIQTSAPPSFATQTPYPQAISTEFQHFVQSDPIQQIDVGTGNHTVYGSTSYGILGNSLIAAGASDSLIYDAGFVDAGSGNDTINNAGTVFCGSGNDTINGANLVYGGSGNDLIVNAPDVVVGSGNDTILGTEVSNVNINPVTAGTTLIGSSYGADTALLDAYYQSLGISDGYERYTEGGLYYLQIPGGGITYGTASDMAAGTTSSSTVTTNIIAVFSHDGYYSAPDALQQLQLFGYNVTLQQAIANGWMTYINPLPSLAILQDGSVPPAAYYATANTPVSATFSANDYAALAPFFGNGGNGGIAADTVTFGAGVSVSNLQFSWGQVTLSADGSTTASLQQPYTTLNISWGPNQGVDVIIPHSNDPIGSGVQKFVFADGTTMSMADMLALAPPPPSFDPQLFPFQFQPGMGAQVLPSDTQEIDFASAITPSALTVTRSGNDLVISYNNGADTLTASNWYQNPYAMPTVYGKFSDGTLWSSQTLTNLGLVEDGSAGNLLLTGYTGFATQLIGGPNDTLVGVSGNDTYVFNAGDGLVEIKDPGGTSTLSFGTGITPSEISLGVATTSGGVTALELQMGTGGDEVLIDGLNPSDVLGSGTVANFQFANGTSLSYSQLVAQGFDIYGGTGNETLTGTNLDNRIYAGTGNDVLLGSGAADTLYGGSGSDTLTAGAGADQLVGGSGNDTLNAGTGGDTLTGGTGQNTFVFNPGDGQDTVIDTANAQTSLAGGDVMQFGTGVTAADLVFAQQGTGVLVTNTASPSDGILIENFQLGGAAPIATYQFADGSHITYTEDGQGNYTFTRYDAQGNDIGDQWGHANGVTGSDTIDAATQQVLNSTFIAGTGGDTLTGGSGQNTFVFNPGDGQDTVIDTANAQTSLAGGDVMQFGTGVTVADLVFAQQGTGVLVTNTASPGDGILIENFQLGGAAPIATYQFADGSHITYTEDGQGNYTFTRYDAQGNDIGDQWGHADGSTGTDVIDPTTGEVNGTVNDPTAGDSTVFDTTQLGGGITETVKTYTYTDGSTYSTDTVNDPDGSYQRVWYKSDGSWGDDNYDASTGEKWGDAAPVNSGYTLSYDDTVLTGGGTESKITYTYTAGGTSVVDTVKNADGSSTTTVSDGQGDTTTLQYDTLGNLSSDQWSRANGSQGADTYDVQTQQDSGNATLASGQLVSWASTPSGSGSVQTALVPNSTLTGGSGADSLFGFGDGDTLTAGTGGNYVYGSGNGDVLVGGTGNDLLVGTGNNDTFVINAGSGVDTLVASGSNDTLVFGAGITSSMVTLGLGSFLIRIGSSGDEVHVEGFDPANAFNTGAIANFQFANGTTLTYDQLVARGFDIYGGSGDIVLSGTDLNNRIYAGGGNDTLIGTGANDTLYGGSGIDTFQGGTGNETFVVNNASDVVQAQSTGTNTNTVETSVSYVAPANVQYLTGTGSGNLSLTGNTLNDVITANSGNDTLTAGSGNDTLISGTGVDTLIGGSGNDSFVVNNASDVIEAGSTTSTIALQGSGGTLDSTAALTVNDAASNTNVTVGGGSSVSLSGSNNYLTAGSASTVDILANTTENYVWLSGGTVNYEGSNTWALTSGSNDAINLASGATGDTTDVFGKNDTISAASGGNSFLLLGSAAVLNSTAAQTVWDYEANAHVNVGAGSTVTVSGNDSEVTVGTGSTVNVYSGTGTGLIGTDSTFNYQGSNIWAGIQGNGNTVNIASGTTGSTAFVVGQNNTVDASSAGNFMTLLNTGNTVNSGTLAESVWAYGDSSTISVGGGSDVALYASNSSATVGGGSNVTVNGSNNMLTAGSASTVDILANTTENYVSLSGGTVNYEGSNTWALTSGSNDVINLASGATGDTTDVFGKNDTISAASGGNSFLLLGSGTSLTSTAAQTVWDYEDNADVSVGDGSSVTVYANASSVTAGANSTVTLSGDNSGVTAGTGSTLDLVSGTGNIISMSGSTANVQGNNEDAVILGDGNTISVASGMSGNTIAILGSNVSITTTAAGNSFSLGDGGPGDTLNSGTAAETVNADGFSAVTVGGGSTVDLNYDYNTLTAGAGSTVNVVFSTGDVITMSDGTVNLGDGDGFGMDTLQINGSGNTIALSSTATDTLTVLGNDNNLTVQAAQNTFDLTGTGNTLDAATLAETVSASSGGNSVTVGGGSSITLGGNTNTVAAGSGSTVDVNSGSGDTLNVSGSSLTLGADVAVTLNGSNDTVTCGTGDTVTGGTNDTYVVNDASDVLQPGSGGINTVESSVNYVAPANVQNLLATGTNAILLTGNTLNDFLLGNAGADTLTGGSGADVLQASSGNTTLADTSGLGALIGGAGNDSLTGGAYNDFFAGGAGNDVLATGASANVISFNKGDGADVLTPTSGANNTLSLGGGINYSDLSFSKSGNDLVLNEGTESLTFSNWYASSANQNVVTLQVIEQASSTFDAASTSALYNQDVVEFGFANLVNQFDSALAANPALTQWSLSNGLLNAYLSGSDTAAMGGDLAYYDGLHGNLTGMNVAAAQAALQNPVFGTQAQAISSWSSISNGTATIR